MAGIGGGGWGGPEPGGGGGGGGVGMERKGWHVSTYEGVLAPGRYGRGVRECARRNRYLLGSSTQHGRRRGGKKAFSSEAPSQPCHLTLQSPDP